MGARATFRGFNDAKSAQLEVRVERTDGSHLYPPMLIFPREPACTREERERVRDGLPRCAASHPGDIGPHHHVRVMTSPTYTSARVRSRRAGSRKRLFATAVKEPETSTAETHAVVARGDRLQEAKEDPAAAQATRTTEPRSATSPRCTTVRRVPVPEPRVRRDPRAAHVCVDEGQARARDAALIAEGKELKDKLAALEGTLGDSSSRRRPEGAQRYAPEVPVGARGSPRCQEVGASATSRRRATWIWARGSGCSTSRRAARYAAHGSCT